MAGTVILWGVLPFFLKALLAQMGAMTISWYRFLIAAGLLYLFIARRRGPGFPLEVLKGPPLLLAGAALGLAGNYMTYVLALKYVGAAVAIVVIQLGPFFMLLGSLVVFREQFSVRQWIGAAVLFGGMALFFNRDLPAVFLPGTATGTGVAILVASALFWSVYSLAQKQLLSRFPSQEIMWFIYCAGALLLLPLASPGEIFRLNPTGLLLLGFCAANTLVAYGFFAEALEHLEASRISVAVTLSPLVTLAVAWAAAKTIPGLLPPEPLSPSSLLGALMVVGGSILAAAGGTRSPDFRR